MLLNCLKAEFVVSFRLLYQLISRADVKYHIFLLYLGRNICHLKQMHYFSICLRMHCKIVFNFAVRHDFSFLQDNRLLAYAF